MSEHNVDNARREALRLVRDRAQQLAHLAPDAARELAEAITDAMALGASGNATSKAVAHALMWDHEPQDAS